MWGLMNNPFRFLRALLRVTALLGMVLFTQSSVRSTEVVIATATSNSGMRYLASGATMEEAVHTALSGLPGARPQAFDVQRGQERSGAAGIGQELRLSPT